MQHHSTTDTTGIQTVSRDAFWQRHVSQWRDSGLSKAAYCQQYSLIYHQMVYWSSKTHKKTVDAEHATSDFIAVNVTSASSVCSTLSIRLPNGCTIEGIDDRSVSLVGRLVEQL